MQYICSGGQPNLKFKFQEFSRSTPGDFMVFPGVAMVEEDPIHTISSSKKTCVKKEINLMPKTNDHSLPCFRGKLNQLLLKT